MAGKDLPVTAQVAAVKSLRETSGLDLDQIAEDHDELTAGVEAVRREDEAAAKAAAKRPAASTRSGRRRGSGSLPVELAADLDAEV